jgi:hypothetical protein
MFETRLICSCPSSSLPSLSLSLFLYQIIPWTRFTYLDLLYLAVDLSPIVKTPSSQATSRSFISQVYNQQLEGEMG